VNYTLISKTETIQAVRVSLSLPSILCAWFGGILWILHGLAMVFSLAFAWAWLGNGNEITALTVVGTALATTILLWLRYRLTRASASRAEELAQLLGLDRHNEESLDYNSTLDATQGQLHISS